MAKVSRRERRLGKKPKDITVEKKEPVVEQETKEIFNPFYRFISDNYKGLLIIPFAMLLLAIGFIGFKVATTGDFIQQGVSLKGGVTLTVLEHTDLDLSLLESELRTQYPRSDLTVRDFQTTGGFIVTAAIDGDDTHVIDTFLQAVRDTSGLMLEEDDYSLEVMGSTLGQSFFRETLKSLAMAFIFMGTVVFLYFSTETMPKLISVVLAIILAAIVFAGNSMIFTILAALIAAFMLYMFYQYSIPSVAVILAALSDIVVTVAVFNLLDLRLTTAGIAAFLMLIGYSVDTDILLSVRVLKRTRGSLKARIWDAMKTGLTMNFSTMAAIIVALMLSESQVLSQIMTILLIGLIVDIINTWLQNAGILRWYLER